MFLFGIDGATFTLLRPWAQAGHLPALARLMAEGAWGPLMSTTPALTPPAWNSMVTGVYPGKHGVYGFVKRKPDSYELAVVTSRDRGRPALWNLLDRAGRRSVVVDVPFTYPPEPVNGIMVSGLGTPDTTTEFVYPASLRPVLLERFGAYPLDIYFDGDVRKLLDDAQRLTDHRLAVAGYLVREYPWDFFMLGLMTTDRLQHVLWKYMDPGHSRHDPGEARAIMPAILDYYRHLDRTIGALREAAGPETVFIVASDHGFGAFERSFSLMRWLGRTGLVALGTRCWEYAPPESVHPFEPRGPGRVARGSATPGRAAGGTDLTFLVDAPDQYAGAVFTLSGLEPSRRYELRARVVGATAGAMLEFDDLTRQDFPIIGGGPVPAFGGDVAAVFQPTGTVMQLMVCMTTYGGNPIGYISIDRLTLIGREDWSQTRAYMLDTGMATEGRRIRINAKGREPQGIVEMGAEYEGIRERIAAELRQLRDETGKPLIGQVYLREALYRGAHADEGPDLVVIYADGVGEISQAPDLIGYSDDGPLSRRLTSGNSGNHRPEGILLMAGPGVRPGVQLSARIVDVCPTIMHLMGVQGPDDLDGRVLHDALEAEHHIVRPAPAAEVASEPPGPGSREVYSDDERRKIEDRLRRLGYIE